MNAPKNAKNGNFKSDHRAGRFSIAQGLGILRGKAPDKSSKVRFVGWARDGKVDLK
jgi:hypothetical protein